MKLSPPTNEEAIAGQALASRSTQHTQMMPVQWSPVGHPSLGRPQSSVAGKTIKGSQQNFSAARGKSAKRLGNGGVKDIR